MDPSCKQCSFAMKRRHIGLQQLQAITSTAHAFLGPNKRLKFIQDEDAGDAVLIGSCPRLLEHLELDGSVGQLLHETVLAQKKLFHSGTNTLMFLAGAWSRVALECLNRGISVSDIKSAMRGGLQECLDACTQSAVSVEEFKKSDVRSNDRCIDMMVKHSRYINAQTENTQSEVSVEEFKKSDITYGDQCMDMTLKHSRYVNAQTEPTQSDDNVQDFRKLAIKSDDQCMDMTLKHSRYVNTQTEHAQSDVNMQGFKGTDIKSDDQCMDMTHKHSRYVNAQTEPTQSDDNVQDFRKLGIKSDDQCMDMTLKHSRYANTQTEHTQSDVDMQDFKGSDIKSDDQCMYMTLKHSRYVSTQTEHAQSDVDMQDFKGTDIKSDDQCMDMTHKHSRYVNARTKNTQSDDNVQDFRKLGIKSDDQCMDMTLKHSRYANTQTEHAQSDVDMQDFKGSDIKSDDQCMYMTLKHSRYANTQTKNTQSDVNVQDFKGSGIKSNDQCMDMTLKQSRYINTQTEHAQSNVNMQDFRKLDDKSDAQCMHMTLKHSRHFNARTKNTQSDVNVQDLKGSDIKSNDQCMDMTLKHSTHFNAQTEHNMQDFRKVDDKSDDQCMHMTLKHSRHFNAQTEHTQSEVTMQDFTKSDIKLDNQCMHMTLKHSRHFNAQTEHTHHDVTVIAQAISHGCSSMHLVLKAYELQNRAHLNIHNLATCCIPGVSEDHACVLRGYVALLSVQQTTQVQRLQGRPLNIALINGDLSEKYRHVGFNRPGNIKHINDLFITEESWIENAFKLLHDSSIDVVFVSGVVDVDLKQRCADVLMLEGVKSSVLKHFSTCTGAVPVSYICQLDERRVGRGLRLRKESISGRSDIVSITTDCSVLVTAVICSSVSAKLQMLEDEFWSCAHRLQHALTDGKLLHGAGVTELICIRRLRQYTQLHPDRSPHDSAVLELMSEAWMDFISTVMLNSGSVANRTEAWTSITHQMRRHTDIGVTDGLGVYDNVTVKCEAWRRALDLVFLVLQSDTEIITGVSQGENTYNQLMFL